MSIYEFDSQNDIIRNRIKAHPRTYFFLNNKKRFYSDQALPLSDASAAVNGNETIHHTPRGYLSLYEININRTESAGNSGLVYPFITKQGTLSSFKTVSTSAFQGFPYGAEISGSYPLSSSISIDHYEQGSDRRRITSLRNTFDYYKTLSLHYSYNSELGNKSSQEIKLISIPSIFYGTEIKKGTVKLNFYVTGSLAATVEDINRNGELVQTYSESGVGDGSVAGVVLYREGFVSLTGSWDLHPTYTDVFLNDDDPPIPPRWTFWGQESLPDVEAATFCPSASWDIGFLGTTYTPVLTMFAHAQEGHLNHSNNPTYISYSDRSTIEQVKVSPRRIVENKERRLANIVKSHYSNHSASYDKITYISKIGVYDEHKNLIAIAKLANPVKKTESRSYTFKMKLDI